MKDETNDILADEFHIRLKGVKAYVATVVAQSCFLCMEACAQANEKALKIAYGVFKLQKVILLRIDNKKSLMRKKITTPPSKF